MNKIAIATPIGGETGGPEALHQLCHTIRSFGVDAYLLPWEGTENNKPVDNYSGYDAPIDLSLAKDTTLIVPETVPELILRGNRSVIWWLSVENSPLAKSKLFNAGKLEESEDILSSSEFWAKFHSPYLRHCAQSFYARDFVQRVFHTKAKMLTDYINQNDFNDLSRLNEELVTFSHKGSSYFPFFKDGLNDFNCVQISGMSKQRAMESLASSRLYIDLGHQPGRDRLPREAALSRAHVMLNKDGAGAIFKDAPLSDDYKFNVGDSYAAVEKIRNYLKEKPTPRMSQIVYRNWVKSQESIFKMEVWKLLKTL